MSREDVLAEALRRAREALKGARCPAVLDNGVTKEWTAWYGERDAILTSSFELLEAARATPQTPVVDPGVCGCGHGRSFHVHGKHCVGLLEEGRNLCNCPAFARPRASTATKAPCWDCGGKMETCGSCGGARGQASTGRAVRPALDIAHEIQDGWLNAGTGHFDLLDRIVAAIERDRLVETPGADALELLREPMPRFCYHHSLGTAPACGECWGCRREAFLAKHPAGSTGK